MDLLIEDGYYLSDGHKHIDWHAGLKFESTNYIAFWFKKNNVVNYAAKDGITVFDKNEFVSEGEYKLNDETTTIYIDRGGKFEVKRTFIVIQKGQIMDENDEIYIYKLWN
ncbi:hypothetical protein [Pontibacter virosus]|uniref:Lipocalin-like protein n=1 Tax=Pontibacter virosus TaxID=1765052 RepID=A0A2U1ALY8_9BACT|nr:hypothetical protein [Pontibacter virosus]PVY37357.1 hypothetical protein C8E01_12148 [Pontibacter virosus]